MADLGSDTLFQPLNQQRAFEQIIFQIEEAIVAGRLHPGDRLPSEREMAETFGVSRASVREAMRALEMFGVVVARRGTGPEAGSIVAASARDGLQNALRLHAGLGRIPVRDIVDTRAVLESHAAAEAARAADPGAVAELREIIVRMARADSIAACHELDTEFHVALARASGNALLPVLMEALRGVMRRDMLRGYTRLRAWRDQRDELVVQHGDIVAAIERGDSAGAADAVRGHVVGFYQDVIDEDDGGAARRRPRRAARGGKTGRASRASA